MDQRWVKNGWKPVKRDRPCKICGRPNPEHTSRFCTYHSGRDLSHCMFTPGGREVKSGGWIYGDADIFKDDRRPARRKTLTEYADMGELSRHYQLLGRSHLARIASEIRGATESALERLGCGFDGSAATFPMYDQRRVCIGIRRRFADGKKLSVKGGHEGAFLPDGFPEREPVYVCEGPTDTAAVLSVGLEAIGRPSAMSGAEIIASLVRGLRVVIVSDTGDAGECGARNLARLISGAKVWTPPAKDVREWIGAGGGSAAMSIVAREQW